MLFRLFNALASFQDYINKILAEKINIFVIVYLNNIFIYTDNPGQDHVKVVWWVLDILRKYDLYANLKKCLFYKNKVCFLGYIVSAQTVSIEDKWIKVRKNWPKPKSV